MIRAGIILRYLITDDDETDTLITAKSSEIDLLTNDFEIYIALTSIKPGDNFNLHKLKKLFEVVEIENYTQKFQRKKPVITEELVKKVRTLALGGN